MDRLIDGMTSWDSTAGAAGREIVHLGTASGERGDKRSRRDAQWLCIGP
jgi:hypothetical protein